MLPLADLVGVHREEVRRLAALHGVHKRIEGPALEASSAAGAEVLARALLLLLVLDLLPLGGRHAARDVRGEFREARRRRGGRDEGERRRDERREEPVLRHGV